MAIRLVALESMFSGGRTTHTKGISAATVTLPGSFAPLSWTALRVELVGAVAGSGESKLLVCSGLAPRGFVRIGTWGLPMHTTVEGPSVEVCRAAGTSSPPSPTWLFGVEGQPL